MSENNSSSELWKHQSESEFDHQWRESDRRFHRTINEFRIELGLLPLNYSDSREDQVYDRIILVKIHFLKYSISCRELDMVFSRFGVLEKLEILSPRSLFHSRICFENKESARMAFDSLNGRNVYDDCCELELFLMREIMVEPSENVEKECKSFDSRLQETHYNNGNQVGDRTLLVQIHFLEYKISYKELELVFSRFGILENIEILGPNAEFHSKVCFEKKKSALEAIDFLNGRNVYDGCCKLELILEKDLLRNQSEDQCLTSSKKSGDEISFEVDEDFTKLERDDEIEIAGPEIVPSMVALASKNSAFDAYNLFDEMSDLQICLEPELTSCTVFNESLWTMSEIEDHRNASFGTRKLEKLTVVGEAWDLEFDKGMEKIEKPRTSLKMVDDKCLQALKSELKVQFGATIEFPSWIGGDQKHRSIGVGMPCAKDKLYIASTGFGIHTNKGNSLGMQECSHLGRTIGDLLLIPYDRGKVHLPMMILGFEIESSIDLLSVFGDFLGSIASTISLTFDPGGRNEFPLHNGRLDTFVILVFDPGIICY